MSTLHVILACALTIWTLFGIGLYVDMTKWYTHWRNRDCPMPLRRLVAATILGGPLVWTAKGLALIGRPIGKLWGAFDDWLDR